MKTDLLLKIRLEFKKDADPAKAKQMQAYMKSKMPYHGVSSPMVRSVCKSIFKTIDLPNSQIWQKHVLHIWHNAKFREERYAALNLAADKRAIIFHTPDAIPMFEELIVSGAWWDFVDDIATHRVSLVLQSHPKPISKLMLQWSKDKNIWKRRTSILCQLPFKNKTDLDLLYCCIEPSIDSKEFFLRKGIGWALRQIAWHNPDEIIRYVKKNKSRLSPLTKREALKNLLRSGQIKLIP